MKYILSLLLLLIPITAFSQATDYQYVGQYNALLNGSTCTDTTLNGAVSSSSARIINLSPVNRAKVACSWTINTNLTVPATKNLFIPKGALVSIAGGVTLTACIEAGDYQIFDSQGSLVIPSGCTKEVKAIWWPKTNAGLTLADAAAATSGIGMIVNGGTWDITGNITLNSIHKIEKGGLFSIANGVTITNNTCPNIGNSYQTFILAGTAKISLSCSQVSPEWWGWTCDGVTNNSGLLNNINDSLPVTGGTLKLPAAQLPCLYSVPFLSTKPVNMIGVGAETSARIDKPAETILQYTGSGVAMKLDGINTAGSVFRGFELEHTGTATIGIEVDNTNNITIDQVTINTPTVKFTEAAIKGNTTAGHTLTIQGSIIRDSAPTGVLFPNGNAMSIFNSSVNHHSACNVELGTAGGTKVKDVHLLLSRFEHGTLNQVGAYAICNHNTEHLIVDSNRFEISTGASGIFKMVSTDTQCENCIFEKNYIALINSEDPELYPTGVFLIDAPGTNPSAYILFHRNRVVDSRGGGEGAPFINIFEIGNTSGFGGVTYLDIQDNELAIGTQLGLINDTTRVAQHYKRANNWQLGTNVMLDPETKTVCSTLTEVGNVATGEDNLMPACVIPRNRIYSGSHGLEIIEAGFTAGNANLKQVKVKFAGTTIFDTGAVAANAQAFMVHCIGKRVGGGTISFVCRGNLLSATMLTTRTAMSGIDYTTALSIQVTGEGVANNDINHEMQHVTLLRAN